MTFNTHYFQVVWKHEIRNDQLILSHTSPDGDQGFPGTVDVQVTFEVTDDGEVKLQYRATSRDKATPINLTSHPYFNLGGEGSGNIHSHNVTIFADQYTPVDSNLIPTGTFRLSVELRCCLRVNFLFSNSWSGAISSVEGTVFDLRSSRQLADVINDVEDGGFDHNFCLRGPTGSRMAARYNLKENSASNVYLK